MSPRSFSITRGIQLRDTSEADLPTLFEQQQDPAANHMAAFTSREPTDPTAFASHWRMVLGDETVTKKTILVRGQIAGYVLMYIWGGKPQIGYWLGTQYWGQGIATAALRKFLQQVRVRPLYARAARDNIASLRVLAKCGFVVAGEDKGFANARGQEVEEFLLELS
jgi:RimJ/RimL family protein N-acetyltransferase